MSSAVINVKINEDNEIEYLDYIEDDDEYDNRDEIGTIDDENILVQKSNGVMTIKPKPKTIVEHVCGKCNKIYKSFGVNAIILKIKIYSKVIINKIFIAGFKASHKFVPKFTKGGDRYGKPSRK